MSAWPIENREHRLPILRWKKVIQRRSKTLYDHSGKHGWSWPPRSGWDAGVVIQGHCMLWQFLWTELCQPSCSQWPSSVPSWVGSQVEKKFSGGPFPKIETYYFILLQRSKPWHTTLREGHDLWGKSIPRGSDVSPATNHLGFGHDSLVFFYLFLERANQIGNMSYRFLSESRWPSCPDSRTHSLLVKTSSMTGTSPGRNHLSVRYTGTEKQVQRHCENGISVMNLKNDSLLRRKKKQGDENRTERRRNVQAKWNMEGSTPIQYQEPSSTSDSIR